MSSRVRSPKQRKIALSLSEPSVLHDKPRLPLHLPQIQSKKPLFYDEVLISPNFINISKTQKTESLKPSERSSLGTSRVKSFVVPEVNRILYNRYCEEDRVVQQHEENQQRYRQLMQRIRQKSNARVKQQQRKCLALVYDRLFGPS